jgi:SUMO ligase MMS21 Smc5/6 complex component
MREDSKCDIPVVLIEHSIITKSINTQLLLQQIQQHLQVSAAQTCHHQAICIRKYKKYTAISLHIIIKSMAIGFNCIISFLHFLIHLA